MTEEKQYIPKCIGIILDGNRRFATQQGLPKLEGHRRGFDNVEPIVLAARDLGIAHMAVYAFSTENWNRSAEEVAYLMDLFITMAQTQFKRLKKEHVAVRFVGQRWRFSQKMQDLMQKIEVDAPQSPKLTLWVCLSYGGRAEIVHAANELAMRGETITEESLGKHLWTADMPDPDIIIRTSGEHRLSNFLLWKSAYSELFFPKVFWPAFTKKDLEAVLEEYAQRERRMGK